RCASAPGWARRGSARPGSPRANPLLPAREERWLRSGDSPIPAGRATRRPGRWRGALLELPDAEFLQRILHQLLGRFAQLLVVQRVADRRLHQADVGAAVEARAAEAVGIHLLFLQQPGNRIGQLDLAAGARPGRLRQLEDARR